MANRQSTQPSQPTRPTQQGSGRVMHHGHGGQRQSTQQPQMRQQQPQMRQQQSQMRHAQQQIQQAQQYGVRNVQYDQPQDKPQEEPLYELLNPFYNPMHDSIYAEFVKYFEAPQMVKLKDVGIQPDIYSMYIVKIHALLGIEYRYLITFIFKDEFPPGHVEPLSNLRWQSLQTRTMTTDYNIPIHSYSPRKLPFLDKKIVMADRTDDQYRYTVEGLPITITLLPKNKSRGIEYSPVGNVITSLETYQTIVTL